MTAQEKAATAAMEEWLSHPQELGKKPAKLEIAGTFELHDLFYYIFKFKKSLFDSWKVAVCGGYEKDDLDHCGHIFSDMEAYDLNTAQDKCIRMVEQIRQYLMNQAKNLKETNTKNNANCGDFVGFVLLSTESFDWQMFRNTLKEDWGIECPENSIVQNEEESTLVFTENDMMATVGFMDSRVPNNEAEYWANSNFITREKSIAAAKNHVAHLLIAVLGKNAPQKAGELYVKIVSTCLKASNALGVYDCGTVWIPEQYIESAAAMKNNEFPLMNLVFVGLYQNEKGTNSWTNGLRSFGKDEIEIIDSSQTPADLYDFMYNISSYLISEDTVLRDGETVGATEDQKLPVTRSEGVYVEGETIKIGY